MSLGDSILQTASIARCGSVVVTANDHTIVDLPVQAEARSGEETPSHHRRDARGDRFRLHRRP
jgi:hypothetical protein